ncbi:16S rRNA (uracil1498-N3)-methyltransferase [Filimonas lacunae]|uniref:Ribosomal RNA small subunit methyltransferase E n=1 Tax=Filimonas lacunae TaxID=477680 RepID=A0A173MR45_9BACT|nr:RsmE family RNA methyltransferase [Filimonas lacunae]BAV10145.1 ribosomal RNA small subunit methyltransferase E [Filimonas lacunae]SIT18869.1 16S rRNA (uracil1498-N3)-methyltransferase [Filimonas lacunae]
MSFPYFFEEAVTAGTTQLELSEESRKHVVQVLRMREGESIQLTNGKGDLLTAVIRVADKKQCLVQVTETAFYPKTVRQVAIGISLLKNASRIEWFLEKATETGISEIFPLLCKRTERQHFRFDRMRQILVSAMLQSRQVWLPVLHNPVEIEEVIAQQTHTQKLVAHCEEMQKSNINQLNVAQDVLILIGPEGDFTPAEIELALQKGFEPVSLGSTRLRTETAGVVAAALLVNH